MKSENSKYHDIKKLLKESNIDKKSLHVASDCIYLFSSICDSTYIGRTKRILSTRISAHLPNNLILNASKLPTSAIGREILDSGKVVDKNKLFNVIGRVKILNYFTLRRHQLSGELNPVFVCKRNFLFI